ncbi:MAG: DUF4396 domain-containing protein, partial [Planctomycetales bacterium]
MYQGNYFLAVRKTIFSETVSMNMVMLGMIPDMVLLTHLLPGTDGPLEPKFWFVMSMATLVGGLTAFPINYFLVKFRLKHGCMTMSEKVPDGHQGFRSPEAKDERDLKDTGEGMQDGHQEKHAMHGKGMPGMEMPGMEMPESTGDGMASGEHGDHGGHAMGTLSKGAMFVWVVVTFVLMFAATWATSQVAPIRFAW